MRKVRESVLIVIIFVLMFAGSASAAEGELLSIDKTLIAMMIIFVIAIFVLNSLLFKPLLGLVEKREKLTTGAVKEAGELRARVEQIKKEYDEKLNEVRTQAMEERNEIRREAQAAAEGMIRKAREETQTLLEEARAKIEADAKEIRAKLKPEIEALSQDMASKILGENSS